MTYSDARNWIDKNSNLIGTVDRKGFTVSNLIIVPSNDAERKAFWDAYLFSHNEKSAIVPYIGSDVQVWSVDLGRLESHNILFYNILAE